MTEPIATQSPQTKSTQQFLQERFLQVRKYTESICKPLAIEDYVAQPTEIVSPPKWSLGHTTWFFETFVLEPFQPGYRCFDPDFAFLFNSYYNNAGTRVKRHRRGDLTRPTVEEVYKYRQFVDDEIARLLDKPLPVEALELIELGIHHEQQHQELFWTDLKYTYSLNPLDVRYEGELPFQDQATDGGMAFISVEEGIYLVGFDEEGFCFDNELSKHKVYLQGFEIANRLVTNGEYLEFIEDGGYQNFNFWHDEGWKWVNENGVLAPLYWEKQDGQWVQYTLKGKKSVPMNEPLKHISFYEAFAFAEWKGMRLPTEFEWETASNLFRWGTRWEWTNSAYLPYPGYAKADGAVGEYNGKFMVNQMVLRGASIVTSPGHSRKTYRNFFHPWERWQFNGIRLVK